MIFFVGEKIYPHSKPIISEVMKVWRHLLIWETLFFIGPEPNWQKVDSLSARKILEMEQWNSNVGTEFYRNMSHHIFSKNLLRFGVLGYVLYVFGVQSYLLTFGVWKPHFLDIAKQIKKKQAIFSEWVVGRDSIPRSPNYLLKRSFRCRVGHVKFSVDLWGQQTMMGDHGNMGGKKIKKRPVRQSHW